MTSSTPTLSRGQKCRSPKRGTAGFTLVEVVVAIGIIAFAFVPLMGLLPLGLDVSRQAIDTTVQAQIAQQLTTQAQQTDFSQIKSLNTGSGANSGWFFDDQGNKCAQAGAIYQATLNVSPTTTLPGLVNITTTKLATVTISVINLKSQQPNKDADSRKFVVLIPDNGR